MAGVDNQDIATVSVHLVDEEKRFAKGLDKYVEKCYNGGLDKQNGDDGLNYHIVSVFGSQSTGKSTLLNRLFGTKFDVMDEEKRQQTTKGIWFSHANYIASAGADETGKRANDNNIYVLDVEGVDGRERADDKDFERKSALFALATSEVLIVNIFEHQVGLYQGANMELLKTVMEVNLSLFHEQSQKCLLLFVIRDFTGLTPLSNLGQSLEDDMNKIWVDLNKPEQCTDSKLEDFFDLKFFSISHKHYQPEKFEYNIKQLGDDFTDDKLFNHNAYHKRIPIDAWALYSEKVWDQIENNKDLDLPTQQILVSKFKCNEIMNSIYEDVFLKEYAEVPAPASDPIASCAFFKSLRAKCLSLYDSQAARYKSTVYADVRKELKSKIDFKLKAFQTAILSNLAESLISKLDTEFPGIKKSDPKRPFKELLESATADTLDEFKAAASGYVLVDGGDEGDEANANSDAADGAVYSDNYDLELQKLEKRLQELSHALKTRESHILIGRITKKFQTRFKDCVVEELSEPCAESWDHILARFDDLSEKLLRPYRSGSQFDFQIGLSVAENEAVHRRLLKNLWNKFDTTAHDYVNDDTAARILRNVFEDAFKFDSNGLPLIWKTFGQLDTQFNKAREHALALLPVLCRISRSDGAVVEKPTFAVGGVAPDGDADDDDVAGGSSGSSDDDNDYSDGTSAPGQTARPSRFLTLLTPKQQAKVRVRFKRETDAIYLDAKRSMVANKTSIPTFMYVLLVLLGWNEFMAVVRNPLLFVLAILALTGLYFAYNMQLLGPMLTVTNAMVQQTKLVVKEKLRDVLLDEPAAPPPKPAAAATATAVDDGYELQDL